MKITVPTGSQSILSRDGTVNPAWYTLFQRLAGLSNTISDAVGATSSLSGQVGALVIPSATQDFAEHVTIDYADDRAYPVVQHSECAWTISTVVTKCSTGTCTVTIDIDGVPLGGGSSSTSSAEVSVSHEAGNEVAVGSTITVTISSNASAESVAVSIVGTRVLTVL